MKRINAVTSICLFGAVLLFGACSGKEAEGAAKSMSQIHQEEGVPVNVQMMNAEPFSVYLKFPAQFNAQTESTAYASLSEVVREVGFSVGDYIEKDQIVVSLSLDNPKYQQARLGFESAEAAYKRTKALFDENGVSRQEYDNARTQYEISRENFKSISDLIEVRAPISGYLTRLNVKKSSNVSPGDSLFTVSNLDGYEALFYVTPGEIESIEQGAKAKIENGNEILTGYISEVALNLDPRKKAFPARAYFSGTPKSLVSGMSVDVEIEAYHSDAAMVVKRKDLIQTGGGWYGFVVEEDKAVKRRLTVGRTRGLELEILEGLDPGDMLITDGSRNLTENMPVKIIDRLVSGN